MANNAAQLTFNVAEAEKLAREWPQRIRAYKRLAMLKIVREVLESLQDDAPVLEGEDKPYTNHLDIYRVRGSDTYAILHDGRVPTKHLSDLDGETTALYVKPPGRPIGKQGAIAQLLAPFSPFTLRSWPAVLNRSPAVVVYRSVRRDEVRRIYNRNLKDQHSMKQALARVGVRFKVDEYAAEDVEAVSDIVFQVLRLEFGLGTRKQPHWRPGIRKGQSSAVLRWVAEQPQIVRTLSDPRYPGWRSLGMIRKVIEARDLEELREFQERIFGT